MVVDRPADEVFDAVGEAARRLHWQVVAEEPPERGRASGHIEADDRTLILGFVDDVVVRVEARRRADPDRRALAVALRAV